MDKLNDYNYLQEGYSFPQGYIIPPSSELKNLKVQPETNSLAFVSFKYQLIQSLNFLSFNFSQLFTFSSIMKSTMENKKQ
jgi:hypothetical protein